MISSTKPSCRSRFQALPPEVRSLAVKNFRLWLSDPFDPSIHFKRVGQFWSARVGSDYRPSATVTGKRVEWFWIGPLGEYDRILKGR